MAILTAWAPAYQFAQALTRDLNLSIKYLSWARYSNDETKTMTMTSKMQSSHVQLSLFEKVKPVGYSSFGREQDETEKLQWAEVYRTYQSLRQLCEIINKTFGSLLTVYLANVILFNATGMDSVLYIRNISYQIRMMFFIVNSTLMMVFAADTCRQVGQKIIFKLIMEYHVNIII